MAIKRTYKIIMALETMRQSPRFEGLELDPDNTTNAMVIDIMHAACYSWDKRRQVWAISTKRENYVTGKANGALKHVDSHNRVQIRLMGPMGTLKALASDFAEVADLIGLSVTNVTDAKAMREGGTWGRIYITAEVR